MTEIATRNIENEAQAVKTELVDFLFEQAHNELLPQSRRDEYALAADILQVEGEIVFNQGGTAVAVDVDHWPAAQSFVIRMTEGLL